MGKLEQIILYQHLEVHCPHSSKLILRSELDNPRHKRSSSLEESLGSPVTKVLPSLDTRHAPLAVMNILDSHPVLTPNL